MIGTSFLEYVFIRLSIGGLRAIAPASILFCGYCVFRPPHSTGLRIILTYATTEAAFYLLACLPRTILLQRAAQHPAVLAPQERKQLFQRCIETIPDPERYLTKWFLDSDLSEIKRDNLKEFFRWAFLNKETVDDADEEELEQYVHEAEKHLGVKLDPGRGKAKSLRLTIDRVLTTHRPLVWYGIVGFVDTAVAIYLRSQSFHHYRTPIQDLLYSLPFRLWTVTSRHRPEASDLSYWLRPHTSKARLPVVFIHGIGIGLYPYARFLASIDSRDKSQSDGDDGEVGVLAVEILPISARMTSPIQTEEYICAAINDIVTSLGWHKFVLVSHSYGTVIATQLLRDEAIAPKIGPMLLIDPVVFLLHLPDVAYNFTIRKPRHANEHQLHYFASRDMGVSSTLSRHFFWSKYVLWEEDLADRDVTVSLGGRDLIVNTEEVGRYLIRSQGGDPDDVSWKERRESAANAPEHTNDSGLQMLWFETCDHAQQFETAEEREQLLRVVRRYCRPRSDSVHVDAA